LGGEGGGGLTTLGMMGSSVGEIEWAINLPMLEEGPFDSGYLKQNCLIGMVASSGWNLLLHRDGIC
jgi:hypothetical protein